MDSAANIGMEICRLEANHLIASCQRGDADAFRSLFEMHKGRVYSIALHFTANETHARDIVQQVFLKLYRDIAKFRYQSEFTTWLYRLVANACFDERRSWKRWVSLGDHPTIFQMPGKDDPERDLVQEETRRAVRTAVTSLRPKLRIVVVLKYVEGLSYDEIGQVLDCSTGTVASRLNRAHKALAGRLGELRQR